MQHDNHLIPFLKAGFGITVELSREWYGPREYVAYESKYANAFEWCHDDVTHEYGPTVFRAAYEYAAAYDGALFDRLYEIEMGERLAIVQLAEMLEAQL